MINRPLPKGRLVLIDTADSPGASRRPPVTADGQLPRRHRADHAQPATGRRSTRPDHLDRVGEHRPGWTGNGAGQRVELDQQRR